MKRVAITTLGCKINQFESAAMTEMLVNEGFATVPFEEVADYYVINTCTVTAKTDAESRRLIRRAQRSNPHARIVVTGCYAQVNAAEVGKIPGVHLVIGNSEKRGIAGFLRDEVAAGSVVVADIARETDGGGIPLETFSEHTRAFLQVQNGCDFFCSYCIVPYARGRSRSVPFAEVLAGIRRFAEMGYREVVLTGIHLGGYGLDLIPERSLLELLTEAEHSMPLERLRIGSVEPIEFSDELTAFLASSRKICRHFHIPLQSGDDQVLGRMNRRYSTAFYREVVERLRAAVPDACIGADIIAGFPGESEKEFERTYHFIESLPLAYLHVFPFSARPGTPAATMDEQLNPAVIKERAQLLRRLSERKRRAYFRSFIGKKLEVLVQEDLGDGMVKGLSRNYIPVVFGGDGSLLNTEVDVVVADVIRDGVRGDRC